LVVDDVTEIRKEMLSLLWIDHILNVCLMPYISYLLLKFIFSSYALGIAMAV
jgi:hypothetical protein